MHVYESLSFCIENSQSACLVFFSVLADLRNKIKKEREDFDRANKMSDVEMQELTKRRALSDKMGLTGEEKTSKDLSTAEINRIDEGYKRFLNAILGASKAGDGIDSEDIPQPMDLNRLFQDWWSKAEWDDKSLLFVELTEDNQHGLLRKAKWNFQGKALGYPLNM
jgi:hypothetical protein